MLPNSLSHGDVIVYRGRTLARNLRGVLAEDFKVGQARHQPFLAMADKVDRHFLISRAFAYLRYASFAKLGMEYSLSRL